MDDGEAPRTVDVDGMELHLDPEPDENGELHTALPPRLESWRRRSAAGAILTGIGLGLKAALEPERDEPSIIVQTSGDPPSDLPVEADLGGILPGNNVVRIRPWLLPGDASPPVPATVADLPTVQAGTEMADIPPVPASSDGAEGAEGDHGRPEAGTDPPDGDSSAAGNAQ